MEDEKKTVDTEEVKATETAEKEPADTPELPDVPEEELLEAPKEEAPAEDTEAKEDAARTAAIDEMEKATQKALDAMREKDNPENAKVVDDAEEEAREIFDDFSKWMKDNTQPERLKAEFKVVSEKIAEVLENARKSAIAVSQSEDFKKTMESGKNFVLGTAGLIGDGLKFGYDKLMEIPELRKISDKVNDKVDDLRHSETLRSAVDRSEEGFNQFTNALFSGIKSFFTQPEAKEGKEDKHDLPDLPEDTDGE
ncbi:hypothetical protein [Allobaculum fili]|uniref:hypothetical protein n=2 Tax=Allobaculum TaxID=174708 RepID=UPI001E5FFF28|nr:hypothetical protein [Allobaculum fili]